MIFLLIIIAYQDYKYRAITWIMLPILFLVNFISAGYDKGLQMTIENTLTNSLFLTVQFTLVYLFFRTKKGSPTSFTGHFIGWGDLLYFAAITPCYSIVIFICYLVSGMLFTLFAYFMWQLFSFRSIRHIKIPLAGILAIYLIFINIYLVLFPENSLREGIDSLLFRTFLLS
jgi:hypothetical protein